MVHVSFGGVSQIRAFMLGVSKLRWCLDRSRHRGQGQRFIKSLLGCQNPLVDVGDSCYPHAVWKETWISCCRSCFRSLVMLTLFILAQWSRSLLAFFPLLCSPTNLLVFWPVSRCPLHTFGTVQGHKANLLCPCMSYGLGGLPNKLQMPPHSSAKLFPHEAFRFSKSI